MLIISRKQKQPLMSEASMKRKRAKKDEVYMDVHSQEFADLKQWMRGNWGKRRTNDLATSNKVYA
jgi:hypothetical protein